MFRAKLASVVGISIKYHRQASLQTLFGYYSLLCMPIGSLQQLLPSFVVTKRKPIGYEILRPTENTFYWRLVRLLN